MESGGNGRDLGDFYRDDTNFMVPELCSNICSSLGLRYIGLQYRYYSLNNTETNTDLKALNIYKRNMLWI